MPQLSLRIKVKSWEVCAENASRRDLLKAMFSVDFSQSWFIIMATTNPSGATSFKKSNSVLGKTKRHGYSITSGISLTFGDAQLAMFKENVKKNTWCRQWFQCKRERKINLDPPWGKDRNIHELLLLSRSVEPKLKGRLLSDPAWANYLLSKVHSQ